MSNSNFNAKLLTIVLIIFLLPSCSTIAEKGELRKHAEPVFIDLQIDSDFSDLSRYHLFQSFYYVFINKGYYIYPYILTDYMRQHQLLLKQRHAILNVVVTRDKTDLLESEVETYRYNFSLMDSQKGTLYWRKKGIFKVDYDCTFGKGWSGGGASGTDAIGYLFLAPFMLVSYAVDCINDEDEINVRLKNYSTMHSSFNQLFENFIREELSNDLPLGPNYYASDVPAIGKH